MTVAILGYEGQIGSSFVSHIIKVRPNINLIKVSRNNSKNGISFDKFLKLEKYIDVIIDSALLDYNDSMRLRKFLEKNEFGKFYHISTVSIIHDIKSEYALNKSNTYFLFKNIKKVEILFGDLFLYEGRFLGYWSYMKPKSFYFSYRNINVFLTETIIDNILNKSEIGIISINAIKLPKFIIFILFKLRINRVLSIFRINLIK